MSSKARVLLAMSPLLLLAGTCEREVGKGLQTSEATILVSQSSPANPANGASSSPSISSDGFLIAFATYATNLGLVDTNDVSDIVLKNRKTGAFTMISVPEPAVGIGNESNKDSFNPFVSADGKFVVFESSGSLTPLGETNLKLKIFRRDLSLAKTQDVSVTTNGGVPMEDCLSPSVSSEGRHVAFATWADMGFTGGFSQIYTRDMDDANPATALKLVSHKDGASATKGNNLSTDPVISSDGNFIAFWSDATDLVPGGTSGRQVFVWRRGDEGIEQVSFRPQGGTMTGIIGSPVPSISADGRFVAFRTFNSDTGPVAQIFLRDRQEGTTFLLSKDGSGSQANKDCDHPVISLDGRWIAFQTAATNLVANSNGMIQVVLFDRTAATFRIVSIDSQGVPANGGESIARGISLSAEGRSIVFSSIATNLVISDFNGSRDIFLHEIIR